MICDGADAVRCCVGPGELQPRDCTRIQSTTDLRKRIWAFAFSLGLMANVPIAFAADAVGPTQKPQAATSPAGSAPTAELLQVRRRWWAYQPLRAEQPSAVRQAAWAQTDIDRFILAEQEARGLAPAAPAEKRILIRRATFGLIGLPSEEVDVFSATILPKPSRVVERLLASQLGCAMGSTGLIGPLRGLPHADPKARTASYEPLRHGAIGIGWLIIAISHSTSSSCTRSPGSVAESDGEALYPEDRHHVPGQRRLGPGDADKEKWSATWLMTRDTVGKAFLA